MKNANTKKLLIAALSLLILLTAAFGLSAFAADNDATPVIASKNISYEGSLHIYYAIPKTASVTAENTTLKIYDSNPETNSAANLIDTYTGSVETIEVLGGGEYIVVRTGGIAAKDMAKYVYAQAESNGSKSAVVRYSVLEYLYERLYTDECTTVQTNLYNSTLKYGMDAQAALTNYPELVETPISEYAYIYVDPSVGTLDAEGNYSGLYTEGTKLTLNYTGADKFNNWKVKNITTTGENEVSLDANELEVTNTAIISANTTAAVPGARPAYTFDKDGVLPDGFSVAGWDTVNGASTTPSVTVANGKVTVDSNTLGVKDTIRINPTETTEEEILSWVFEADITSVGTKIDGSYGGNCFLIFRDNKDGQEHPVQVGLRDGADKGIWFQAYGGSSYGAVSGTPAVDSKEFHLKAEYTLVDGKGSVEIFINGTSYGKISDPNRPALTLDIINQFRFEIGYSYQNAVTMDNIMFYPTTAADNEPVTPPTEDKPVTPPVEEKPARPAYTFDGDTLPDGFSVAGWDTVNGASTTPSVTVANGKVTVDSNTLGVKDTIRINPTETTEEEILSWIFEADITSVGTKIDSSYGGNCFLIFRDNKDGAEHKIQIGLRDGVDKGIWLQAYGGSSYGAVSGTPAKDSVEFNLKLEYYLKDTAAAVKVYINGTSYGEISDPNQTMIDLAIINQFRFEIGYSYQNAVTMDNIMFYPTTAADNEPVTPPVEDEPARPAYTFDGDTLPDGFSVAGWDTVNGASTTPSVTVANGKVTVDSNTLGVKDTIRINPTEATTGNTWVFEADITSVGTKIDSSYGGNCFLIFRDNKDGAEHKIQIGLRDGVDKGIWLQAYGGSSYGAVSGTPAKDSVEFNLKLEYYLKDTAAAVRVYINGNYCGEISDPNQTMIDLDTVNQFRFEIGYSYQNAVTMDNVRFYRADTTAPAV